MTLLEALDITRPCVVSCVGAGGKTSLLLSLAAALRAKGAPFLLTSTTKMGYHQVEEFTPVMADDFVQGMVQVRVRLNDAGFAAWFSRRDGEKIIGISPALIDQLHILEPSLHILVEADGARGKLLKVPESHEPVIPGCNYVTLGVLNTDAIGQPVSAAIIHHMELAAKIIGKEAGQLIEATDIALLAGHQQGIFCTIRKYNFSQCISATTAFAVARGSAEAGFSNNCSAGKKILMLTGKHIENINAVEMAGYVAQNNHVGIEKCVFVKGFGTEMKLLQVYCL